MTLVRITHDRRAEARADGAWLAVVAVVAFAVHRLGVLFFDDAQGISVAWPASGVWLAMVLLGPRRLWPAIIATIGLVSLAADLYFVGSFAISAGWVTSNLLEVSLGACTMAALCGPDIRFTRTRDALALIVVATLVNAVASVPGAWAGARYGTAGFWPSYRSWWIADGLGLLIVTPLVTSWVALARRDLRPRLRPRAIAERVGFVAVTAVASWLAFEHRAATSVSPYAYILVCLLVLGGLRVGMRTISLAIAVLGAIALHAAMDGGALLDGETAAERVTSAQLYLGVVAVTGFLLTTSAEERRAAEEAAHQAEDRLRMAVQAAGMGAWIWDIGAARIRWSAEVESIFGLPPGTFDGSYEAYVALIHPDDRHRVRAKIARTLDGTDGDYTIAHRITARDGSTRWVEGVGRVFRDGEGRPVRMAGTVVDVTRRKQDDALLRHANRALAASEALVRQFVKHTPAAVAMFDRDMRYLYASDRWVADYKLGGQALIGRSHYEVFPDIPERWKDIHRRVLAGAVERVDEDPFPRADGSLEWLEWEVRPWLAPDGAIGGLIMFTQVITRRKKLEEELRQAQKMDAIGQLAGGVAHDFNNLLGVMLLEADSLGGDLPPDVAAAFGEIRRAAERAADLTRQLLAFSRRQVMQPRSGNLNDLVRELGKMLGRIVGEQVSFRLELDDRPLPIHADFGMIDQVVMNLVVNARDAMPGGGQLVIQTGERVLTEDEARTMMDATPGRYVSLRVRDTGDGIPPEAYDHLFEPFFTTKPVGQGTGLGLATVFGIVKQHRGHVRFESELGRGTTFEVLLPATAEAARDADASAASPPRRGSERVLLVEDDPLLRRATRVVLRRNGYAVLEAANGPEAVRVWETTSEPIHLLLTDVVMPDGMNGFELAAILGERRPELRVVFTSGYSPELAGREVTLEHGHNFLQKPASSRVLLETIRTCLDA